MSKTRIIPNPNSTLLKAAMVGGVGLGLPADQAPPPPGMAVVLLYVPVQELTKYTMPEIQRDLGLPWAADDGTGVWLDELAH